MKYRKCYLVHDDTVLDCDYKHRLAMLITLDKTKAELYASRDGGLRITEVPLDREIDKLGYGVSVE